MRAGGCPAANSSLTYVRISGQLLIAAIRSGDAVLFGKVLCILQPASCHSHNLCTQKSKILDLYPQINRKGKLLRGTLLMLHVALHISIPRIFSSTLLKRFIIALNRHANQI